LQAEEALEAEDSENEDSDDEEEEGDDSNMGKKTAKKSAFPKCDNDDEGLGKKMEKLDMSGSSKVCVWIPATVKMMMATRS